MYMKEGGSMNIMQELQSVYGYNTPIFLNDLKINGMTDVGIRQAVSRLSKDGRIERYTQGVYYIPQVTPFGRSKLDARKVYEKKFIQNETEIYGYYSGLALENAIGLTTQMPNIIEIVTNNESSRIREISVGSQKLRLRRSKVTITCENAGILQFLDLMKQKTWSALSTSEKNRIIDFAKKQGIKKKAIYGYISFYPARTAKNILESRVLDELM